MPDRCRFWEGVRGDFNRLTRGRSAVKSVLTAILNRGFKAVMCYRLAHACWRWKIPLAPELISRVAQLLYAVDISYRAQLGPGIVIVHGFGVVIGSEARLEGDCCIFHGVTLGDRGSEWVQSTRQDGHPNVGAGVMLGAGAKILGPISIGRNCVVGANAVVLSDVGDNSIVAGIPAKVVGTRPAMTNALRPMH